MNAIALSGMLAALLAPPQVFDKSASDGGAPIEAVAAGDFTMQIAGIVERPASALPASGVTPQSFTASVFALELMNVSEPFVLIEGLLTRKFYESANWYLEIDALDGSVLALRKPTTVDPSPQDENAIREESEMRMMSWGVSPQEVIRVLQRRTMWQHENDQGASAPQLHRYKTFFIRGINGVEIEGNRAVLTYHRDGSFHRALLHWPPLATAGHRLRSDLPIAEIVERVQLELMQAGEFEGDVELGWKYVPKQMSNGAIALELVVSAKLAGVSHAEHDEEPRVFNVSIDAY